MISDSSKGDGLEEADEGNVLTLLGVGAVGIVSLR